jgi:hypothetical protein
MKKHINRIMIATLTVLILTACGGTEPTQDVNAIMTSAVSSMVASFFETQTALVPIPTPTLVPSMTPLPSPTIIYPTSTLGPTLTPVYILYSITPGTITPTGTLPTSTVNSSALAVGCNNLAFIRDVTIPAGTVIEKNQSFRKTWKVQNTGTCDWMYQYSLVLVGGDAPGGSNSKIQKTVPVWSWSELSVDLEAPKKPGTYTSSWRLSNGQSLFGATLTVSFVVLDVAPTAVPPTATLSPTTAPAATPTPTPTSTQAPTQTPTPTPTPTPT